MALTQELLSLYTLSVICIKVLVLVYEQRQYSFDDVVERLESLSVGVLHDLEKVLNLGRPLFVALICKMRASPRFYQE